jgi:hypothetical protein
MSRSNMSEMDPKFLKKNTLLQIVSRAARPEKKSSTRPRYYMRGLPVIEGFKELKESIKEIFFSEKLKLNLFQLSNWFFLHNNRWLNSSIGVH